MIGLLLMGGCSQRAPIEWTGPVRPSLSRIDPWDPKVPQSRCVVTPHYRIYTDVQDPDTLDQLPQLMEGAYQQYQMLCPGIPLSAQALNCYIFSRREQWASFTQAHTGKDAAVYLQISRGAYTVDDWFVAFWLGDRGTYSVAAHEGFHQFVARNYAGRLAPALEEGFACMFESVEWEGRLPRWAIGHSDKRCGDLADAMGAKRLWPLSRLLRMHAGDVISLSRAQIDTFYAQNWAFAVFLWEGEGRKCRPALQRYLADLSAGRAYRPPGYANLRPHDWNPNLAVLQLEYYLGTSLSQLDAEYVQFCRELAREAPRQDSCGAP